MSIGKLLRQQWEGYPRFHQSRVNLLIHIVAVPLFLLGALIFVAALAQGSLLSLSVAVASIVLALALQGRGHRSEPIPPRPFSGVGNFITRLLLEQWVTFPRFVLSGAWGKAMQAGQKAGRSIDPHFRDLS